jgi:TRAP-type mannitol/chloroaromatic compound transport system permease small subunit
LGKYVRELSERITSKDAEGIILITKRVDELITKIASLSSYLVLVTIFANFFSAFLRYVFRAPNMWFFFISTWSMGLLCLLGAAYTLKTGGHIYVDLLYNKINSPNIRQVLDYLVLTATLVSLAVLLYISSLAAWYSTIINEADETYVLIRPPIWWYKWFLVASLVLLVLETFSLFLHLGRSKEG